MLPRCESDTGKNHSNSSTLYLYLVGVTAEVLSKAGGPNAERLSVGTANSSLLSMLRGSRTNTCRHVTSQPGRLIALRRSSIAEGCTFIFWGRFTIRRTLGNAFQCSPAICHFLWSAREFYKVTREPFKIYFCRPRGRGKGIKRARGIKYYSEIMQVSPSYTAEDYFNFFESARRESRSRD